MDCGIRPRGSIFATLSFLLLSGPAAAAYVRVFAVFQSGQHARVQTMKDGKLLPGVTVEVYRGFGPHGEFPDSRPVAVLTSDQSGWVTLPTLSNGRYLILARSNPNLKDWLYLYVATELQTMQPFTLSLAPQPPTPAERLAAAEASTNILVVSRLLGTVRDPSGALIPGATVDVLIRGTQGKQRAASVRTEASGRFSFDLPDGKYVLRISAEGFDPYFESIAVSSSGSAVELKIKLEIAPAST